MRKQDCIIAEWAGDSKHWAFRPGENADCPNGVAWHGTKYYTTSDADAISLLPVLVARGNIPALTSRISEDGETYWRCAACACDTPSHSGWTGDASTIAAAITAAIIQLIESEGTL